MVLNNLVDDLAYLLKVKQRNLRIISESKGLVAGSI